MNYTLVTKMAIEPFGDKLIDDVLHESYADIIYSQWDKSTMGAAQDFGGGVIGVSCKQLYQLCDGSHYVLANKFKGISRPDAKEIMTVLSQHLEN